ncbi:hypothetical protein KCV05_g7263, partial [Aureobasidium melanogenum]
MQTLSRDTNLSSIQIPPISQALPQGGPPNMTTLQPSHPDHYRSLPPPPMYGHAPPGHYQQPLPYPPQPAPRQRTAIACRYCRRRKIRCSGFDQSEDGRCTNCQRFSQECVFTPVSAQSQAFVPAHTVWRQQGAPPQQLYGAYGQPLPPQQHAARDPYPPPQHAYPPPQGYPQVPPAYAMPPGHVPQGPPPAHVAPPQPTGTPNPAQEAGRKRPNEEPHTPTLPPPNPAQAAQIPQQGPPPPHAQPQYTYPDPTVLTPAAGSPASSNTSFQSAQPHAQPYFAPAPARKPSPQQNNYAYDQPRASHSPHAHAASVTPAAYNPAVTSHPESKPVPSNSERSSPTNTARGVRINELVGPSGQPQAQSQQNHTQAPPPPPSTAAHSQQPQQAPGAPQNASQQAQNQANSEGSRSQADSNMLSKLNNPRM